jgi:hypothetical protein
MAWTFDYADIVLGASLSAVCAWSMLQISRSGVVRGRMGGAWTRRQRPAAYWLSASALAAGLGAGVFVAAAGFGAASPLAATLASATAAGSLVALSRWGKATNRT